MADQINIQLRFTVDTKYGPYSDALWFTEDEWAKRDDVAIEAMKQSRVDAHVASIDGRQKPTKEDYQALAASIDAQAIEAAAELADRKQKALEAADAAAVVESVAVRG